MACLRTQISCQDSSNGRVVFSGTQQMCNRINLQTTQEKQVYHFPGVWHTFFFLLEQKSHIEWQQQMCFPILNTTTSTDVKLKAQVLIRGDTVWQRHYLA